MSTLYSFRRCPYAMRARMALRYAGVAVDIVEVSLKANRQRCSRYRAKARCRCSASTAK